MTRDHCPFTSTLEFKYIGIQVTKSEVWSRFNLTVGPGLRDEVEYWNKYAQRLARARPLDESERSTLVQCRASRFLLSEASPGHRQDSDDWKERISSLASEDLKKL